MMYLKKGEAFSLSPNFSSDEFECPCCRYALVDSRLIQALEQIRVLAGGPITINSGYRCPRHNSKKSVGGAPLSRHLMGVAADITWPAVRGDVAIGTHFRARLVEQAPDLEIFGIGWGKTYIHIDVDSSRKHLTQWTY